MKPLPLGLILTIVVIFAGLIISNAVASQGIAWLAVAIGLLIIVVSIFMQNRQNRTAKKTN